MPTIGLDAARALVAGALVRVGTRAETAAAVADALVAAEADGLEGHGLSRVASYAAQVKAGKVDGSAVPTVERPAPGVLRIDAGHGFAYPALARAVAGLPEVARANGVAVAAIRRSHHCGAAGHPVERLADAGLVALLFANTPAAIAPWGGTRAVFGTNPVAFACPLAAGAPPIVADLSLSKVARGNILAAAQKGAAIPADWALDADGRPTTDPAAALKGTMVPAGDAKGTVLAMIVELLAAGLTGATFAADAASFLDAAGPPPATGQLVVAFDPAVIGGPGVLVHFARLAGMIEAQPGARLPGRRRLELRARAAANGIEVPQAVLDAIRAVG